MKVDKDLPSTWVKFKESMCRRCSGDCCTMPVEVELEDLIRLGVASEDDRFGSRRKLVGRLKRAGVIQSYRDVSGLFMLMQRPSGDCLFLDEGSRLCSAYSRRPDVCRQFPVSMGNRLGFCPMNGKG